MCKQEVEVSPQGAGGDCVISCDIMASFTSYEEDYLRISRILNKHINDLATGPLGGVARVLAEADTDFFEAEGLLKALDVEVRSTYAVDQPKYRDKLAQYQNDLRVLRRDFNNAKARAEKQQLLMGGSRPDPKATTARLMKSTEQLHEARRVVGETEQIGDSIVNQMESQRVQLLSAAEDVVETDYFTKTARQVMNRMHVRAVQHKICLFLIIIFLLTCIGVTIYAIIKRHSHR